MRGKKFIRGHVLAKLHTVTFVVLIKSAANYRSPIKDFL